MPDTAKLLSHAKQLYRTGASEQAEQVYRQILAVEPDEAETLHLLGVLVSTSGRQQEALGLIQRALQVNPEAAVFHGSLGNVYQELGMAEKAADCFRQALKLRPDLIAAHNNLGLALHRLGRLTEAADSLQQAIVIRPDYAAAHNNLGNVLKDLGRREEAMRSYQEALRLRPVYASAHNNIGNFYKEQGKSEEARAAYQQALACDPDFAESHVNLGAVLYQQGNREEAVVHFRRALELRPAYAEGLNTMGSVFLTKGNLEEAVSCLQQAVEAKPTLVEALNNLGVAWREQGELDKAIACFRRALELQSDFIAAHDNLVYTVIFSPHYDAQAIFKEHQRWNRQHAKPLARHIQTHSNERSSDRRLRIGYVSPDFRNHCQAFFLVPLLSCHDHRDFEIFCYADVVCPDEITSRLRAYADTWRDISGLKDEQTAELIRQDGIDILVDLTMHMARNRLLVFARRPTPIQVTWLAYPGTTGLEVIDYRLSDLYLDPPGMFDACYAEKTYRLSHSFWCYDPQTSAPPVTALPALANGYITFGCLNNFCKVHLATLKLWAKVLRALSSSRLILLSPEGNHRQRVLDVLAAEGIDAGRITFVAQQPRPRYLEEYGRIDIALDTLPYNGHTTSLDAYWMGVPVVTLVGQTVVGRAGLCQLSNLDLRELVASTEDEFVNIIVQLAQDLPRLCQLRAGLRARMQSSPLMDAAGFAGDVEAAYRHMWRRWCARKEETGVRRHADS